MSTWISAAGFLATLAILVWRDGAFRGRILTVLEQLTRNDADKEERLRDLEHVSQLYVARVPEAPRRRQRRQRD